MRVCFMVAGRGSARISFMRQVRQLRQFLQYPSFIVDVESYRGFGEDEKGGAIFPIAHLAYDLLPPFLWWANGYLYSKKLSEEGYANILHLCTAIPVDGSLPYIVSIDATGIQLFQLGYRPYLFALKHFPYTHYTKVVWSLERKIYERAEKIICYTEFARKGLIERYMVDQQKICVIPPGVDLEMFNSSGRKYSKDQITLLFVGRDFVRKGGYVLLRAFERLRKKYSVRLVIIGTKERFAVDGVHFAGGVTDSELVQAFRIADIFVLPAFAEAYGLVFLEAMASGLPIVTTNISPRQEVLRDSALFVRPGDANDLELKLAQLIVDTNFRRKLGKKGRQIVETYHNWRKIANQIERIYEASCSKWSYPQFLEQHLNLGNNLDMR